MMSNTMRARLNEAEAVRRALPKLTKIVRYERRAAKKRDDAVRCFFAAAAMPKPAKGGR
jgi:hypothetical protein